MADVVVVVVYGRGGDAVAGGSGGRETRQQRNFSTYCNFKIDPLVRQDKRTTVVRRRKRAHCRSEARIRRALELHRRWAIAAALINARD